MGNSPSTFTPDSWREKAAELLRDIGGWLEQRRRLELPYVAYGTVAGLTLWPLVAAAVQTGQVAPVLGALYSVTAGIGANLIANQIEAWKDQAAPPDEPQVMVWAAQAAGANPDLRQALDAILKDLAAVPQAQAGLNETDRAWFVAQLRQELAGLGNLDRFQADLSGSGAVAQGPNARALGAGAVDAGGSLVEGSIISGRVQAGGDVVGRDKVTHGDEVRGDKIEAATYIARQVVGAPGPDAPALRRAYLHHVLHKSTLLPLAGIDPKAAGDEAGTGLSLEAVYTALMTTGGESGETAVWSPGREQRRLPALAQLDRHARLVLLGDPGSGKSTFVHFVAACLAGEGLDRNDVNLALLTSPLPDEDGRPQAESQPWRPGALLPVHVVLRDFAARGLPAAAGEPATAQHLWRFIAGELAGATLAAYAAPLQDELRRHGGLLLLDGLDEVPEAEQRRAQIKQAVEDFAAAFPQVRLLVTSRTYAYQKQDWQLPGFAVALLDDFAPGQVRCFIERWYSHVADVRGLHPDSAQGQAELLKRAVFSNPRLQDLARRPLLLTLMASLHAWRGGSLPEKREQLYADTVDLLLESWEQPKVVRDAQGNVMVRQPSLAEWLRVERDRVRQLLNRLAFEAHAAQPELHGTADLSEDRLVAGLLDLSQNPELRPRLLVDYLNYRAGLLVPRGIKVYTFPHRTFQEYLAACHLTDDDFPDQLAALARQDPDRWREVALLAAAKAARGGAFAAWTLVDALCGDEPNDDPAEAWGAHLAGQALVETARLDGLNRANQRKVERLQRWLLHLMGGADLPALERASASATLARLGDPRPEVMEVDAMRFCYVPAGPFFMGSDNALQGDNKFMQAVYDSEKPLHEVNIPYPYWLARYPVTNAQFQAFVDAGGYSEAEHWPEAQEAGAWQAGQVRAQTWIPEKRKSEQMTRQKPFDYGRPFNLANHPVVGLTWYEALAFCRWLTARWRAQGQLAAGWTAQLPSEAEWEKATRGGHRLPATALIRTLDEGVEAEVTLVENEQPRRLYPWGEAEAGDARANYQTTDIPTTSGVGCFPRGASPYGCQEMSGNVLEWTRSLWGEWGENDFTFVFTYPYEVGSDREVLANGIEWARVVRGGSWGAGDTWLRCASRDGDSPDLWYGYNGFRVCVSPFSMPASGR